MLQRFGGLGLLAAGLILYTASYRYPSFAVWYASYVYPIFRHTVGRAAGWLPFSLFELIIFSLVVFHRNVLLRITYYVSLFFLIFILTAGINYNREYYAVHVGITVQNSSAEDLIRLYLMLVERANGLADQIETDERGVFALSRGNLNHTARQAMLDLNAKYGGLGTYFPKAKAPFTSRLTLSNLNISGFFAPWTMEAHYNSDMPDSDIPFVIAHELAHFAGFMREDEANFIAYLAAAYSPCPDFQYSAVKNAISSVLNSYWRAAFDTDGYDELYSLLPAQLQRDFIAGSEYWRQFRGRAADISHRANDTYLRVNRQDDGVQSYGRMVDLLLGYYN
jgi:hypothetical protein